MTTPISRCANRIACLLIGVLSLYLATMMRERQAVWVIKAIVCLKDTSLPAASVVPHDLFFPM